MHGPSLAPPALLPAHGLKVFAGGSSAKCKDTRVPPGLQISQKQQLKRKAVGRGAPPIGEVAQDNGQGWSL